MGMKSYQTDDWANISRISVIHLLESIFATHVMITRYKFMIDYFQEEETIPGCTNNY